MCIIYSDSIIWAHDPALLAVPFEVQCVKGGTCALFILNLSFGLMILLCWQSPLSAMC